MKCDLYGYSDCLSQAMCGSQKDVMLVRRAQVPSPVKPSTFLLLTQNKNEDENGHDKTGRSTPSLVWEELKADFTKVIVHSWVAPRGTQRLILEVDLTP